LSEEPGPPDDEEAHHASPMEGGAKILPK